MDAQQLYLAADAIREALGARFEGTYDQGVASMRRVLQDRLQLDESAADRIVKQMANGRLVLFHPAGEVDERTGPDVRDQAEFYDHEARADDISGIPPQGLSTSVGIAGTGMNLVPPVPETGMEGTKRDDYIDRGEVGLRDLGAADADSAGGYWEVPDLPTGSTGSGSGPAGPDYSRHG